MIQKTKKSDLQRHTEALAQGARVMPYVPAQNFSQGDNKNYIPQCGWYHERMPNGAIVKQNVLHLRGKALKKQRNLQQQNKFSL